MVIRRIGEIFVAEAPFAEKDIIKSAGFRWNAIAKHWWTAETAKAIKFFDMADEPTKHFLAGHKLNAEERVIASAATSADITIPAPDGCEYMPFQRAGIAFGVTVTKSINERSKDLSASGVLIADEMGL